MYNACYGGFGLSEAAMEAYRARCPDVDPELSEYAISRHDPVMVEIVKELGEAASDRYAKIRFRRVPVQYKDFYQIREYDGLESVVILKNEFKLDAVKCILNDRSLSKADKLTRISAVVNHEDDES